MALTTSIHKAWIRQLCSQSPSNDLYTMAVLEHYAGDIAADFVAFWGELAGVQHVGAMRIDATHIPLESVTTEGYRSVFEAMCTPRLSRVHLRLSWDITLPAFREAMAADSARNDAAALGDRITVESLWVEDAISKRYKKLAEDTSEFKKLAKSLEPFSTYARIEASTQERQVCAAVEAWCNGKILSDSLAWQEFVLGENLAAGEIDGVVEGRVGDERCIVFVEVKHSVAKNYGKAVSALAGATQVWRELTDASPGELEGTAQRLYDVLCVDKNRDANVIKVIRGSDVSDKNKVYAQRDGIELFEPAPVDPLGYVRVVPAK